jgi:hypothetical protein
MVVAKLILLVGLWLTCLAVVRRAHHKGPIEALVWVVLAVSGMALLTFCAAACSQPEPCPVVQAKPATDPRDAALIIMRYSNAGPRPICGAFAVRDGTRVRLITAAHCVPGLKPGEPLRFATRRQWSATSDGVSSGTVLWNDPDRDRAEFVASDDHDAEALARVALEIGPALSYERIHTIGPSFDYARLDGRVLGGVSSNLGAYWSTDLDITFGWSGSPVIDAQGRAIGIVVSCQARLIEPETCLAHSANFVDLVGLPGL